MWGFLGKNKSDDPYNPFKVDVHSHLIPGLDDGVESMEETLQILSGFQQQGFKKVITTPHVMADYYHNSTEDIISGLESVRDSVQEAGIAIEIEAAAEYYLDETLVQRLADKETLLSFGRQRFLLFETSFMNEPVFLREAIFAMNTNGYTPVLAHPERYLYLHEKKDLVDSLLAMNVHFQLNLLSLTGFYSRAVRRFAERLLAIGAIRLVGSDCHNSTHFSSFVKVLTKKGIRKIDEQNVLNNALL